MVTRGQGGRQWRVKCLMSTVSVPGGGKVLETDSGGDSQYECT